jgi:sec-independent protein translocase protein TatA
MVGPLGAPELIIIAVVVVLIFGVGKISGLGRELGSSIREFRRAVKDEDAEVRKQAGTQTSQTTQQLPTAPPPPPVAAQPPSNRQGSESTNRNDPNVF